MPKIVFLPHADLCPEGAALDAENGETVLDVALRNGIDIEHACEKSCACTTCHVIVREGFDSLEESTELEDDMLDKAWGRGRRQWQQRWVRSAGAAHSVRPAGRHLWYPDAERHQNRPAP